MRNRLKSQGFALPTVIVTSVVLFAVLVAAVGTVASTSVSLDSQYYESLAADAAESGAAQVDSCLQNNNFISQWGSNNLTPGTDCYGSVVSGQSNYVLATPQYQTTYTVGPVQNSGSGIQTAQIIGAVQKVRSSGAVWKTFTKSISIRVGAQVSALGTYFSYSGNSAYVSFFILGGDGVLRGVGSNNYGQLGNGTLTNTLSPQPIQLPYGVGVSSSSPTPVATNFLNVGQAVGVIGSDNQAYFSGPNESGQRGDGTISGTPPSSLSRFILPAGKTAKVLVPVGPNNYVITNDGYVYAAGYCNSGRLGNGTNGSGCNAATPVLVQGLPTPNSSNPSTMPIAITGDGAVRHVQMADGSVYGWGDNGNGNVGNLGGAVGVNDAQTAVTATPLRTVTYAASAFGAGNKYCTYGDTTTSPCVVDVEETSRNTYALLNNGTVWAAGDNSYGMLGVPSSVPWSSTFRQITLPAGDTVATQISADAYEVVILTSNGNVYSTGLNRGPSSPYYGGAAGCGVPTSGSSTCPYDTAAGITINGTAVNVLKFQLPAGVKGTYIRNTSINTDGRYMNTFVVGSDSKVYAAGDDTYGQLGDGCTLSSPAGPNATCSSSLNGQPGGVVGSPVVMKVVDGSTAIAIPTQVQSGAGTTIVRTTTGLVYAVGRNHVGQLGDGSISNASTPRANSFLNQTTAQVY